MLSSVSDCQVSNKVPRKQCCRLQFKVFTSSSSRGSVPDAWKSMSRLTIIIAHVRGRLTRLERLTVGALVVVDVHARDVVKGLADQAVGDETDFQWMSQLRYMYEGTNVLGSKARGQVEVMVVFRRKAQVWVDKGDEGSRETWAQAENKRTMENGNIQVIQEGGPKRRKTVDAEGKEEVVSLPANKKGEEMRTDSKGTGSEKTREVSKGEGDNTTTDSEEDLHKSLHWLRDYVEKVKREREHAFDIRATCLKHEERSQRSVKKGLGLTLMNIHPLIAARYVEKFDEWQIATDVSFQIPCFEEGQKVVVALHEKISTEYPLGVYDSMPCNSDQEDAHPQPEHEGSASQHAEQGRHSPQAFSPLIFKLPNTTKLRSGMKWRPWRTFTTMPYSVLAGSSLPAELAAVSLSLLVATGMLDGDGDLDARAYSVDWDRFYRSDGSDDEALEWHSDDEKEEEDQLGGIVSNNEDGEDLGNNLSAENIIQRVMANYMSAMPANHAVNGKGKKQAESEEDDDDDDDDDDDEGYGHWHISGAQLTPHRRAVLEQIPMGHRTTDGGSADIRGDNVVVEVDPDFGGTAEHANRDIGADMDDLPPRTAEVTNAAGGDVLSTSNPGLGMGEGFTALLHHVAPIAPSGSKKDFCEHLSVMSPMRIDFEEQTPYWARFTRPTPPGTSKMELELWRHRPAVTLASEVTGCPATSCRDCTFGGVAGLLLGLLAWDDAAAEDLAWKWGVAGGVGVGVGVGVVEEPFGLPNRPTKHHIELLPGAVPPKGCIYRMSPAELEELRRQLETLTSRGWIRPNTSEFGAPILFVPKGSGEFRMCIDYRGLNKITRKSTEPLPRIDDLLDMVQVCTIFSKVDLKSGYHLIEMADEDVHKTAFKTRYGTYEYLVMPFGLCNAPGTFQSEMHRIFRPYLDKFMVVYLDDILVFNKTTREHAEHLALVLQSLRDSQYKINREKSSFGVPSVIYLGHVISGNGLAPEAAKVAAIQDWPQPQTVRDVRSFLGLASYYRKFVRNFSAAAAPLTNLTKKDTPFLWSLHCQMAFARLKQALTHAPVLKLPDPTLPFVLTTDASQYGIGAVLQQDDGNGLRPVEFMSKKIKTQKLQDSTYEKELYALVNLLYTYSKGEERLCIPEDQQLRTLLMSECHDARGHFGFLKSYAALSQRFFWKEMRSDMLRYVDTCELCQRNKVQRKPPLGLLKPLPIPDGPAQSVSIDFTDLGKTTPRGMRQGMVCVDRFSKYEEFIPLPEVARVPVVRAAFSERWVTHHGPPTSIVSDRDPRFCSDEWQSYCKDYLHSRLDMTSARHPEANGLAEVMNQVLFQLLRPVISPDQQDWDLHLARAHLMYNMFVHSSTGFSPYRLHWGRQPRQPLDDIIDKAKPDLTLGTAEFARRYRLDVERARANLLKAQKAMIEQANRHRRPSPYRTADYVWVASSELSREEDISPKLLPRYLGPWQVLDTVGADPFGPSYVIDQAEILGLDNSVAHLQDRLQRLEQRPVAAADAGSSNTTDRLNALELDVGSLKDGAEVQQTATQQLQQRLGTTATTSSPEPRESAPKFDGQEIFRDSIKTDPIPWFRKFELTLQLHNVKEHKHHAYLYSRSGGACQAWLDNLLSKYGVVAADLHTKISWDDLKAAWHKRFQVEPPEIKAMDKLMVFEQGTLPSTDWIAEYQRLTSVPNIQMGFKAIRHYFISRSYPALSNALTHVEDTLTTTAELFDKAAQIIVTNKEAKNLCSSAKANPTAIQLADGKTQQLLDRYIEAVPVYFAPHACEPVTFDILDTDFDIILGIPWLASGDHTVNFHRRTLSIRDAFGAEVACTIPLPHPSIRCQVVTAKSFRATCAYEQPEEIGLCFLRTVAVADSSPTDLSSDPRVVRLLDEFADIFESPTGVVPGRPISHEIILEAGVVPPKGCIYWMSEEELEVLRAQLDDLFAKGWIRPSSSPYGALVLFVGKKNKDLRLCIDYRKLNAQTVKNVGPVPRIDDLLERLGGAKYFSKLDLKSGYHQISIRPNDRYKTAFKTRYVHFEWVVMPFGLTNAPATFQAAMTNEFRAMLDRFVLVYLDDILVYSRSLEDHLGHLRRVLETLRRNKYKANRDKCEFVRQELEYLGHFVTPEGISLLSDKIQAVQEWPEPRNVTDVRSFLGLTGYYQRFIKGYSKIAAHLNKLQCEDRPFDFGEEARGSFLALKVALLSAEVLRIYDPLAPTRVTTDWSGYGIGAVLEQHDGVDWHAVDYFSKKVPLVHSIDDARKKELLAFVHALKRWWHFLLGRSQFRWVTDNNPLVFYKTQGTVNSTIARWMTFIDQFDFFPDHISGKSNHFADALSRRPDHCTAVYSTFEIDDDLRNSFIRSYPADPDFRDKHANCSSHNPTPSHYRIQEGYLLVHTRGKDLLCVPSDPHLRTRLLGEFQDAPATGHFGVCRRCKSHNHRPYGELRPLPVPLRRREAIAMDITGPFPKHKTGVDGILTVVDRLTKFAMFLPCRYHAKAPELAEVLYAGWIRTKGYPKEIVCDRDTRFMSDFWLVLIKRWGSSLKPSSARHPQTDGQTERAHQTAQVLLRTLIRPDQKDRVERLLDVELAYNSSIHPAIGISPFAFEHGSPVTSPLDTITPRTAESDDHLLFLRQMQELLVKARDQMAKTQQRMSQQANRQRLPCPFRVGDLVWVSAAEFSLEQDISRKLLPKWMGPWPIIEPAGDAPEQPSFTIQVLSHLPVYRVFHCSKLALYTPAEHDDFPGRRTQDPPSMDGFQEVGDIISQRRYGNKPTEYLVHFAYCTHRTDRWLTRAELQATAPDRQAPSHVVMDTVHV
ncbi:hypothetical protein CBR_g31471 [Chara braunii]|uniref:Reverse transcriptase n=1 Tax=Chara braunii TaxID=69332 RepID=A0A388LF34_CHABU|nr:hypothetical protein CBR_g31471 [Chara braunii]|eukprot:GBG80915.1 hypothetical protein CBR_g31471 [Chara braunii]